MNAADPRAHRSRLVSLADRAIGAAWSARTLRRPVLDAQALLGNLQAETGLSDFGDQWFRKPLDVLLTALSEEAALNRLGLFAAEVQLRKVLKDRLHTQALLADNRLIGGRSLSAPVVVVGPMRSGTTRLHRLLAADARFAHMRSFETINPVPRPGFAPGDPDHRSVLARVAQGAVRAFNPGTAAIHPSGPFDPEEELGLLVRSIWGMKHEVQWQVPTYARWCENQDAAPAYRHMASLLRLIGWARGDDDTRPWVLKTPQHMLDLPALLEVFPDARIIFIHRNPCAVVGSSCSLVWNQMIIHSDRVDPGMIGREWLRKTELQIGRMREARAAIAKGRRIDVRYDDMERDWRRVMRRIYSFLDMDIDQALPAMASYMATADKERSRNPHRYSLSAFGLDARQVEERFADYTASFALPGRTGQPLARPASKPVLPSVDLHPEWQRAPAAPQVARHS